MEFSASSLPSSQPAGHRGNKCLRRRHPRQTFTYVAAYLVKGLPAVAWGDTFKVQQRV